MMKKLLCALLCVLLLLPFAAHAETTESLTWSLEGNVLCISGKMEGSDAFPWASAADSVKTLRISDGVTEIPAGAFRNFSKLQYLTIPDSLRYIGDSAFENCASLCWLKLPDGLIGIGESAFAGGGKLSPVYLPESVAWIGDRAFDSTAVLNCYANSAGQDYVADNGGTYRQTKTHELATTRGSWGDAGVWTLESGSMVLSGSGAVECDADGRYPWDAYRADILTVELGEGITSLGKDAFALCRKLTKVTFPASIETVDDGALSARAEIVGFAGTAAETFAANRGLTFTAIEAQEDAAAQTGAAEQANSNEVKTIEETTPAESEAAEQPAPTETETAEQPAPTETEAVEQTAPTETEAAEQTVPTETETAEQNAPAETEATEETTPAETKEADQTAPSETEAADQTAPTETGTAEETAPAETEAAQEEKKPVLSVQAVTAQPGQTVQLTVTLSDNPGLCGLYFGIDYDHTKLTLEDYSCPSADFDQGDWMVGIGGQERAVWLQPDQTEAEGAILTLKFLIASDAGTEDIAVTLTGVAGVDAQAGKVDVSAAPGGVKIALGLPGDINGDGRITYADLVRLHRYLSGQNVAAETGNADLNGDGKVDLLDLMLLQLLLTGQSEK